MSQSRPSPFLASLAVMVGLAAPAGAAPYEVVLASGERVAASSRPLMALGKVSFLDESRRPVTLSTAAVNVEATRANLSDIPKAGKVWDEKALAKLDSQKVQFYGDDMGSPAEATEARRGEPTPLDSDKSPMERLRSRIDTLGEKIRVLPTTDRDRSLMVIQQLELQQELSRLLDQPAPRG